MILLTQKDPTLSEVFSCVDIWKVYRQISRFHQACCVIYPTCTLLAWKGWMEPDYSEAIPVDKYLSNQSLYLLNDIETV